MKKSLIALAAMAVAGIASAQSSVTLFGVLDAGVSNYQTQSSTPFNGSVKLSKTALSSSGYNSSRLGFRGTEDLGGGLAASFWLEAGLNNDTGTGNGTGGGLTFNRRSTVSLSGAFGEIRLGRDYTPTFWNDTVFDPFGTNGVGTNLIYTANGGSTSAPANSGFVANTNYVRASNAIQYFLPPNLGGFYGQAMYSFNENTSITPGGLTGGAGTGTTATNSRANKYIGGRVGYANGPLDVALAYAQSTMASDYFAGSTTNLNIWNLGASYDFGPVKLFGEYSNNKQKTTLANNVFNPFGVSKPGANGGLLGVTVPIGAGLIRASYSAVKYNNVGTYDVFGYRAPQPKADQFALGYVYNLSKRTALYATFAYINDKNGANLSIQGAPAFYTGSVSGLFGPNTAVPNKSYGYDLGIRHAF